MIYLYKLIGRLPVPCRDPQEWSEWFGTTDRHVAKTDIGPLWVSTVFLGITAFADDRGAPLLFETMIFDSGEDQYQTRCATWDEAQKQHAEAVEIARERLAAADTMLKAESPPDKEHS